MWKHISHLHKTCEMYSYGQFFLELLAPFSSLSQISTVMAEAITMIETQRSSTGTVLTTL